MIHNLPLHLKENKREKPNTNVIVLPGINAMSYNLSVGNAKVYNHLSHVEMIAVTVHDINTFRKVVRDRIGLNVLPSYIVINLDEHRQQLPALMQYIRSTDRLLATPVFVYVGEMSPGLKEELVKIGGIDGVITGATTVEIFTQQLTFARKIKALSAANTPNRRRILARSRVVLNYALKRSFDIGVSGTALILLSPVFAVIAALIRLESKGKVFYSAPRAGKMYQVFPFYKFRTMVANADKLVNDLTHLNQYDVEGNKGPVFFKLTNDPRVTKFGSFLRNTSLDELPQLFNVLKGDMSLVGNRPLPLYEAITLTTDDFAQRFIAPAGITGLWQVKKRGKKEMSVDERIGLDIDYARKHSFFYDMRILASTPKALVQKENV
jgi:lipopolysaccharide/colanic/teichoic acid biosynthesis glycosyltransferase